jgi:hypothetical protein
MLVPFADDVWTDARRGTFYGVQTGSRMTVVRLGDGGLFVHSPVALDAATRAEVDALGPVRVVVAPSIFHHLHVGAWMAAYPDAHFACCPGLEWKRRDLAFGGVLGDAPDARWAKDLSQVYFSARRENEVDFFHAASGTLILTDALLNLARHEDRATRLVARLMGNTGPGEGWMEPLMVRDRRLARRQVDRLLALPFTRIVLAHGAVIERDARDVLRHAYCWL